MAVGRVGQHRKLTGRSRCEKCNHALSAAELVPIIGWLVLRGKCQKCHKKIGVEPLLIELATACFFSASYLLWTHNNFATPIGVVLFSLWLVILTGLILLAFLDIKYQKLPDKIILPVVAVSVVFWVFSSVVNEQNICSALTSLVYSTIPIAGIYGLVFVLSRGKMVGLGDVKLGIIIGLLLPWWGSVMVLFLANNLAMVMLLPMLLRKKLKTTDQIPFGPFLIISTIAVFFVMKLFVNFF
jgi:prepilin signal peptidase PulO-like enzyme (type II secretory pathway)